jgi:uncharacterized membrane protein YkvI
MRPVTLALLGIALHGVLSVVIGYAGMLVLLEPDHWTALPRYWDIVVRSRFHPHRSWFLIAYGGFAFLVSSSVALAVCHRLTEGRRPRKRMIAGVTALAGILGMAKLQVAWSLLFTAGRWLNGYDQLMLFGADLLAAAWIPVSIPLHWIAAALLARIVRTIETRP